MDAGDHLKNGASSKSHTSRRNFLQIIVLIICVFPFLVTSCGENEADDFTVIDGYKISNVLYAKGSLLKRVYQSSDNVKSLYSEYKYDESGRISRIDYANRNAYETYLYNANEMLEKIFYYTENPLTLVSSVVISYDDESNKIKEQTFSHLDEMRGVIRLYEYIDGKLTKEEIVVNEQSPQILHYEYNGDKVVKIKSYFMDKCDVTENFYDQNFLIRSISYDANYPNFIKVEIKYYYDRNDNLIKRTIDDRMRGSSSLYTGPYINSWEYEYE
jgi:hypothetical protein